MKVLPNTIINLHEIHNPSWLNNVFESVKRNYNVIQADVLENYYYNGFNLKNSCHITFDDGDISFYNNIFPLVKKHQMPVSIYVSPLMAVEQKNFWFQELSGYNELKLVEAIKKVTGTQKEISGAFIKPYLKTLRLEVIWEIIRTYQKRTNTPTKPPRNMNVNQLKEVKSSGLVEIGAHTLNHPILTNEEDDFAKNEIIHSIDYLSNILNSEVRYFAYPNGSFGNREIAILKNTKAKLAFTTQRMKMSLENNPFSIPRSGTPLIPIPELKHNKLSSYSKCAVQVLFGENLFLQIRAIQEKLSSITGSEYEDKK